VRGQAAGGGKGGKQEGRIRETLCDILSELEWNGTHHRRRIANGLRSAPSSGARQSDGRGS